MPVTSSGIAYDLAHHDSPGTPVVLVHAGVADRTMWDPQWPGLTARRTVARLDLRGFGESTTPATGPWSPAGDVLQVMDEAGIERAHLVAASFGAGVAVEVALTAPERVASLLLSPPGGALFATLTSDLRAFFGREREALAAGDIEAAVEANIDTWVIGHRRSRRAVDPVVVDHVRRMQRQAFIAADLVGEDGEVELDPPALDRLGEIRVPVLVLTGGHDLDVVADAARVVSTGIEGAQYLEWADAAHLPSMERSERFEHLLLERLTTLG